MKIVNIYLFITVWQLVNVEVNAQKFSLSLNGTFEKSYFYHDNDYNGIQIYNLTDSNINLRWDILSIDTIPGTWFALCNDGQCYPDVPDTGAFPTCVPGDSVFLFLHIGPGNTIGTTTIKFLIYETDSLMYNDTITFLIHTTGPDTTNLSIAGHAQANISVYPSLVTNKIIIETKIFPCEYEIFNISGLLIEKNTVNSSNKEIDLSHLPFGNYFIRIKEPELEEILIKKIYKID